MSEYQYYQFDAVIDAYFSEEPEYENFDEGAEGGSNPFRFFHQEIKENHSTSRSCAETPTSRLRNEKDGKEKRLSESEWNISND